MRSVVRVAAAAFALLATSVPAFAGQPTSLPEPISISLLAGGIAAIAAVKHLRRK